MAAGDTTPRECLDPSCSLRRQGAASSSRLSSFREAGRLGEKTTGPALPGPRPEKQSPGSRPAEYPGQSPLQVEAPLPPEPRGPPGATATGPPGQVPPAGRGCTPVHAQEQGRSPPPLPSSPGSPPLDHKPRDQTRVCSKLQSCEGGGRACLHAVCWVTGCNLLQVCSQRTFLPPAFGTEAANTVASSRLGWWSLRRAKSQRVRGEGGGATSI